MGLLTVQRRILTKRGIKPQGLLQWQFEYRWLYGAVEPLSGALYLLEFSHLDSVCFEHFLQMFSRQWPHELHLIQVDNSQAHKARGLTLDLLRKSGES